MKYSANQRRISCFVVGRAGLEYGPPMAVISFFFPFFEFSARQKQKSTDR
ncbi:hypothetical protein [Desulfocicer vacuolatum]|nr:hypothetical protein [Desulfocicer vacuolatum]